MMRRQGGMPSNTRAPAHTHKQTNKHTHTPGRIETLYTDGGKIDSDDDHRRQARALTDSSAH